jgi:hypothetical protein
MKMPTYMKRKYIGGLPHVICLFGLAAWLTASSDARAEDQPVPQEPQRYLWQGGLTLSLDLHIYEDGFRDGEPEFITRYTPLRDYSGDDFPGYFADLTRLSLSLVDSETGRRLFGLERASLAYFNQKNLLFVDPEPFRLQLGHSLYRSQQIKPDNRPDPLAPPNSIFRRFNDDSAGRRDFYVRRNDFDSLLKLRPEVFGQDGSQIGDLDLFYHRSDRESVRFFDYVTTARMVTGTNANAIRWRGIDQRLIEDVNRGGLGFSFSPFRWIDVSYEFTAEKYANTLSRGTLVDVPGLPRFDAGANPGFRDQPDRDQWQLNEVTLGWIPSTTKLVNQIRFAKNIGPGKLNFGYGNVFLDQDEFTLFAMNRGYDRGQIMTHSAYGNWNMPLSSFALWDVHINYRLRDNNSTFPALHPATPPGGVSPLDYLNPLLDGDSHGGVFGPWIASIETFRFGTDFTFLLPVAGSRVVTGWKREDTSRDLVFGNPPPGVRRTIDPPEATVRPDSVNDTFFLNYSARPVRNLRLRWNNAVTFADEVGLISEPETGYKGRVGLTYSMPKLMKGATFDLFYQVRFAENDAFTITSTSLAPPPGTFPSARQERDELFQSAGLTLTLMPSERWVKYAGYIWNRDRLEANFLRTNARRYDNNWGFLSSSSSRYITDAHTGFIGTSYQFTDNLSGSVDYSVTAILGQQGSGEIEAALGRDNDLDNITHHVGAGLAYRVSRHLSVGGRYAYAVYNDEVNRYLSSGFHTVGVLASLTF